MRKNGWKMRNAFPPPDSYILRRTISPFLTNPWGKGVTSLKKKKVRHDPLPPEGSDTLGSKGKDKYKKNSQKMSLVLGHLSAFFCQPPPPRGGGGFAQKTNQSPRERHPPPLGGEGAVTK